MSVTCIKFTELSLLVISLIIYYKTFHVKMLPKEFVEQSFPHKDFEESSVLRREARDVTTSTIASMTDTSSDGTTTAETTPTTTQTTIHEDYMYDMEGIMIFSGFFGGFIIIVSAMLLGIILGCPMDVVSETSYLLLGICLAFAHVYREQMYKPYHKYAENLYNNDTNITANTFWSKYLGQPLSIALACIFVLDLIVSLFFTTDLVAGQCPQ